MANPVLDILIKATLLMVLALVGRFVWRRAAAATRHLVWARAVDLVRQMPFRFQDTEQGPHRRVAGRIGETGMHLAGRGPAEAVDEVHDLAFATGQRGSGSGAHPWQLGVRGAKILASC